MAKNPIPGISDADILQEIERLNKAANALQRTIDNLQKIKVVTIAAIESTGAVVPVIQQEDCPFNLRQMAVFLCVESIKDYNRQVTNLSKLLQHD